MESEFFTHSPEETALLGANLAKKATPGLITLQGDLGTGKTKFTAGLLEELGAEGPYQSPTFMIMKEYHLPKTSPGGINRVYHADAYRLEAKDFESLGFQECLEDKSALTILEWPEKVESVLSEKRTDIIITQISETERKFHIKTYED